MKTWGESVPCKRSIKHNFWKNKRKHWTESTRVGHGAKNGKVALECIMETLAWPIIACYFPSSWLELQHAVMSLGYTIPHHVFLLVFKLCWVQCIFSASESYQIAPYDLFIKLYFLLLFTIKTFKFSVIFHQMLCLSLHFAFHFSLWVHFHSC